MLAALDILAGLVLPERGVSQNAKDIFELYALILVMALVVFVGVEGTLIWFMIKFKARRGQVAAQIHGNTRLEIGWTVGAAVILVFITVVTFIKLPGIKNPPASDIDANGNQVASATLLASTDQPAVPKGAKLNIVVDGQQYVWRYQYPRQDNKVVFAYEEMVVPVGMTVTLDITADDVAHSWWIPALGGKMDAIPGYTNKTWFKADRAGDLRGPVRRALRAQPREHAGAREGPCPSTSTRPGTTGRPPTSMRRARRPPRSASGSRTQRTRAAEQSESE